MTKTTLEQIRQKVMDRKATLSDEVVSVKSLMMDPAQPGKIIIRRPGSAKEDVYSFDPLVYKQTSAVVYGLPGSYLEKLVEGEKGDPGLAALNFNHWVGVSKDKEVLVRFQQRGDERAIRALLSATWNPIPYERSIETLISKFGPDKPVKLTKFDNNGLVIDIVSRRLDDETAGIDRERHARVLRSDPIEWGFRFQDSDAGNMGDLKIAPYTLRLVCTNGATSMSKGVVIGVSHTGKDSQVIDGVMSNLRQGVEMIDGYSARIIDQIEASQGINLRVNDETGEPDSALVRLARDMAVTRLEDKYIREGWRVEGESIKANNLYRLANAVTRAGTHAEELTDESRLKLQAVGGSILETAVYPSHMWN